MDYIDEGSCRVGAEKAFRAEIFWHWVQPNAFFLRNHFVFA